MTTQKVQLNLWITKRQADMLDRLSAISLKPKTVLVREGIETLFKSPESKI